MEEGESEGRAFSLRCSLSCMGGNIDSDLLSLRLLVFRLVVSSACSVGYLATKPCG